VAEQAPNDVPVVVLPAQQENPDAAVAEQEPNPVQQEPQQRAQQVEVFILLVSLCFVIQ
jgi:hypothetical protein